MSIRLDWSIPGKMLHLKLVLCSWRSLGHSIKPRWRKTSRRMDRELCGRCVVCSVPGKSHVLDPTAQCFVYLDLLSATISIHQSAVCLITSDFRVHSLHGALKFCEFLVIKAGLGKWMWGLYICSASSSLASKPSTRGRPCTSRVSGGLSYLNINKLSATKLFISVWSSSDILIPEGRTCKDLRVSKGGTKHQLCEEMQSTAHQLHSVARSRFGDFKRDQRSESMPDDLSHWGDALTLTPAECLAAGPLCLLLFWHLLLWTGDPLRRRSYLDNYWQGRPILFMPPSPPLFPLPVIAPATASLKTTFWARKNGCVCCALPCWDLDIFCFVSYLWATDCAKRHKRRHLLPGHDCWSSRWLSHGSCALVGWKVIIRDAKQWYTWLLIVQNHWVKVALEMQSTDLFNMALS